MFENKCQLVIQLRVGMQQSMLLILDATSNRTRSTMHNKSKLRAKHHLDAAVAYTSYVDAGRWNARTRTVARMHGCSSSTSPSANRPRRGGRPVAPSALYCDSYDRLLLSAWCMPGCNLDRELGRRRTLLSTIEDLTGTRPLERERRTASSGG